MSVCVRVCVCVCVCARAHACAHVCVYVCVCVYKRRGDICIGSMKSRPTTVFLCVSYL